MGHGEVERRIRYNSWASDLSTRMKVSNRWPTGCMQPSTAMSAAQHKIVNLLQSFFFAHQFLLVFVYLMCGPRQLFFFLCGQRRHLVGHP